MSLRRMTSFCFSHILHFKIDDSECTRSDMPQVLRKRHTASFRSASTANQLKHSRYSANLDLSIFMGGPPNSDVHLRGCTLERVHLRSAPNKCEDVFWSQTCGCPSFLLA
eukprot:Selendium_serpulae@DN7697_c0_g1_i1.p2